MRHTPQIPRRPGRAGPGQPPSPQPGQPPRPGGAGRESYSQLFRLGDQHRAASQDAQRKAAAAYERALEKRPHDRGLLHQVLEIYTGIEDWKNAIRTIDRLLDGEGDRPIRARLNYAAAVTLRDQLRRPDLALQRFDLSLDDDPTHLKAFAAIDRILTERRNWAALERAYRKMIKRLPVDENEERELKLNLWKNLGEIYRTRIGDFEKASVAYDIASRLDPANTEIRRILAELYDNLSPAGSEYGGRAVEQHMAMIQSQPGQVENYRLLYNYYRDRGEMERAYAFASVLATFRRANWQEEEFFEQRRPRGLLDPQARLSERTLTKYVFHPDLDPNLSAIFSLSAPAAGNLFARDRYSIPELRGAERVSDRYRHGHLMQALQYAQAILGVPTPQLYARDREDGVSALVPVREGFSFRPALVVFRDLVVDEDPCQLAFTFSRTLAELQPAFFAFVACGRSLEGLRQLFCACLVVSDVLHSHATPIVARLANTLRERVDTVRLNQLRVLVHRCADPGGQQIVDLKRWIGAAQMSLNRIGLLLCGDLPKAALAATREANRGYAPVSAKRALQDLVLYSISENYLQARRQLGLAR